MATVKKSDPAVAAIVEKEVEKAVKAERARCRKAVVGVELPEGAATARGWAEIKRAIKMAIAAE